MSDHQTIPDSNMSDRHNNLPPTSKTENITAMSDRVSPTAQQAAVPTENPPSPQHANGHGHHHEHHHHTAQYGGNISPHETAEHVMAVFDRQMMALSEENTLASHTQACEIAEMLLERAELPLAFRVHAHIVLGCGKMAIFTTPMKLCASPRWAKGSMVLVKRLKPKLLSKI
ncbi:unnamed protein product [Aureobasidium pullulans]|nr:unnamed protein product [Aureobasidium pullulans]